MMRVYIHADDFGLTPGINAHIFRAWKEGLLHSVSIMANGYAFDEGVSLYRESSFELQVHLNFIEGRALHPQSAGSFFCSPEGQFNRSFLNLYLASQRASGTQRTTMKQTIKNEMRAQIDKVKYILKPKSQLRVDSHQHIHMIPLFFESLIELIEELKIGYIRIPREKTSALHALLHRPQILATSNPAKVMLLNSLSGKALRLLKHHSVKHATWFIGLLHTGQMNLKDIQRSFDLIKSNLSSFDEIEILLHPGGALPEEEQYWECYPALKKYYRHPNREKELRELLRPEFKEWIRQITKQA